MNAVTVLVRRDLKLFLVQRSRIVGTIAQPLLFWLVIGTGLSPSFRMPGAEDGPSYTEFFFPGIVVMLLLFTSISTTMSVIEDRHQGFLQGVLAAPGARWQVALGKCLGGALVGVLPAAILMLVAPLAGINVAGINHVIVAASLALTALALTGVGFVIAWKIDSTQGYHVVMSLVLMPLWILSGAFFPLEPTHPVMLWFGRLNPMTYAVSSLRAGMTGGEDALRDLAILAGIALLALLAAMRVARKGGI